MTGQVHNLGLTKIPHWFVQSVFMKIAVFWVVAPCSPLKRW
jgi:hypothetical protein